MDVVDAPSAAPSLWNAVPGVARKPTKRAQEQVHPALRSPSDYEEWVDLFDGFAVRGFSGLVYNEPAFQYLLDIERRRAEGTRHPFLLMLIECDHGPSPRVSPERLLPVVCRSVRETDFVGWYRQGTVVGATLTQDGRRGALRASQIVRERIVKALGSELPTEFVPQLGLRLYEVLGDDELRID